MFCSASKEITTLQTSLSASAKKMEESQAAQAAKMTEVGSMEVPKTGGASDRFSDLRGDRVLADRPGRRGEEGGGRAGSTGGLSRQGPGGGDNSETAVIGGNLFVVHLFCFGPFLGLGAARQASGRKATN